MDDVDDNLFHWSFLNKWLELNKLSNLVATMCKQVGLNGRFTNRSGKRTCATVLFRSGVDEQLIMDRTGHRVQLLCANRYKSESAAQLKTISGHLEPPGAEPSESCVSLLKNEDTSMNCPLDSKTSINLTNCYCTVNIYTKWYMYYVCTYIRMLFLFTFFWHFGFWVSDILGIVSFLPVD